MMKSIIILLASLVLLACASNAEDVKLTAADAPMAKSDHSAAPVDEEDSEGSSIDDELEALARANAFMNAYLRQLIRQRQEQQQELMAENDSPNGDDSDEQQQQLMEKRSRSLTKKESPLEQQRNKEMRRQLAARWDIGFGKRAYKPKSFMDALYGKRSNLFNKQLHPKFAYGRKQQWDIQYGRK